MYKTRTQGIKCKATYKPNSQKFWGYIQRAGQGFGVVLYVCKATNKFLHKIEEIGV